MSSASATGVRTRTSPFEGLMTGSRVRDYAQIAKPRIAVMVLITVTVGYLVGCQGQPHVPTLLCTLLGVALVATASSAFNQCLERRTDRLMPRTADRPLPSGRMSTAEVCGLGIVCTIVGTVWLAVSVNLITAALTAATLVLYVIAYTPLKKQTAACTAVGAIPGALPPVLGWTAAGGTLDHAALSLFGILFLWQFPHFLAIAWLYRHQYAAAGLRMLPGRLPRRGITGLMAVVYALALIPVSLLPTHVGLAGESYAALALVMSSLYLGFSLLFWWDETRRTARRLLWFSLAYLPTMLLALSLDHWRGLQ